MSRVGKSLMISGYSQATSLICLLSLLRRQDRLTKDRRRVESTARRRQAGASQRSNVALLNRPLATIAWAVELPPKPICWRGLDGGGKDVCDQKEPADRLAELLRMTVEERRECERAAGNAGGQPSTWIRQRLVEVARRALKDEGG